MKKNDLNKMIGQAMNDIQSTKKKFTVDSKTKILTIRFPEDEIENLKKTLKIRTGQRSISGGIRAILFRAMHEEGLL